MLRWVALCALAFVWGCHGGKPSAVGAADSASAKASADDPTGIEVRNAPKPDESESTGLVRAGRKLVADRAYVLGPTLHPGWADVLEAPRSDARRIAQAIVGEELLVLQRVGAWCEVVRDRDETWRGWMPATQACPGGREFRKSRERGPLIMVVQAPGVRTEGGSVIPFGAVLPADTTRAVTVRLPDDKIVTLPRVSVTTARALPLMKAIEAAKGFRQTNYQWGGNSPEAIDSEGLIAVIFGATGARLPRDSRRLRDAGVAVEDSTKWRPGDVIFYSTFDPDRAIPVVMLADRATFLYASPSAGVSVGYFDQMRNRSVLAARRYISDPRKIGRSL
jgi:hypothetical protein